MEISDINLAIKYGHLYYDNQTLYAEYEQVVALLGRLDGILDFGTPWTDGTLGINNTALLNQVFVDAHAFLAATKKALQ